MELDCTYRQQAQTSTNDKSLQYDLQIIGRGPLEEVHSAIKLFERNRNIAQSNAQLLKMNARQADRITELEAQIAEMVLFDVLCTNCIHMDWDGGGCSCNKTGIRDIDCTAANCPLKGGRNETDVWKIL